MSEEARDQREDPPYACPKCHGEVIRVSGGEAEARAPSRESGQARRGGQAPKGGQSPKDGQAPKGGMARKGGKTNGSTDGWGCSTCRLLFPIEDDLPNFLLDDALTWRE